MPHTRHLHNSWLNSVGWIHNFVWTLNLDKMVPTEDCTKMYSSSLKRSRSPELKLAQLRKASGHDDVLTDNLRSQKRYLSQVHEAQERPLNAPSISLRQLEEWQVLVDKKFSQLKSIL
ncbi:MAG: hypothetical protein FRX49_03410, partial [Trebouxia sp. A1-2]